MTRVLVVGVPRSGTTWVGRVLASALGTHDLNEPDNHFVSPYAFRAKLHLGQGNYPRLRVGEEAPEYESLWRSAFTAGNGRRSFAERARRRLSRQLLHRQAPDHVTRALTRTERARVGLRTAAVLAVPERPEPHAEAIVVKSVYAALSLEWIEVLCDPRVVIVLRDPLNVISSWLEMNWLADDLLETLSPSFREELAARYEAPVPTEAWSLFRRAAWLVAALTSTLADLGDRSPARMVLSHEALCQDPRASFRTVVESLGLGWGAEPERLLDELDRPGRGYETARVAEGLAEVWRARMSPDLVREARSVFAHFPVHELSRTGVSP
jgi:Sulfotransferase family